MRPKNPHYLNLKLCLVGYAFSGKKLQAQRIKSEYGLDVITLAELVDEALKFYEANPEPIQGEVKPIQESLHEDSREEATKPENEEAAPEEEKKEEEAAQDQPPDQARRKQHHQNE